jgi:hypothetical protein
MTTTAERTTETVPGPVGVSGCADCAHVRLGRPYNGRRPVSCGHPKKASHWRCPMVGNCFYHEPATDTTSDETVTREAGGVE